MKYTILLLLFVLSAKAQTQVIKTGNEDLVGFKTFKSHAGIFTGKTEDLLTPYTDLDSLPKITYITKGDSTGRTIIFKGDSIQSKSEPHWEW